ncbi:hypothetical protein [Mesorhizobium sp.]|uniref:hypothetical protein n=1 Tax=Mesorhizobium sp. TaxID=1871066 RepID=UPI002580BB63|nr:hypothetical protein [Mesorhizobium sp.]
MGKKLGRERMMLDLTPHRGPVILAQSRKALVLSAGPVAIAAARMANLVAQSRRS